MNTKNATTPMTLTTMDVIPSASVNQAHASTRNRAQVQNTQLLQWRAMTETLKTETAAM
jgi:hypothetical protein